MDDVNAAVNSSIQADMSVNSSLHPERLGCSQFKESNFMLTGLFFTKILFLLPLFIFILFLGLQRWQKQRSVSTTATVSHSDFFTYNMIVLELMDIFGSCIYLFGVYMNVLTVKLVGMYMFTLMLFGQTLFHALTCVERYLAVVHPVTYLGLRQASAVRIRNIINGCIWLLLIGSPHVIRTLFNDSVLLILKVLFMVFCVVLVFFCSVSVLCVLIRSRPGEVSGNRERVDQSKQKAFNTIMIIMGVLSVRFVTTMISYSMYISLELLTSYTCMLMGLQHWFCLPSSLVLPLLFLHRAGKLPSCKHNTESA